MNNKGDFFERFTYKTEYGFISATRYHPTGVFYVTKENDGEIIGYLEKPMGDDSSLLQYKFSAGDWHYTRQMRDGCECIAKAFHERKKGELQTQILA